MLFGLLLELYKVVENKDTLLLEKIKLISSRIGYSTFALVSLKVYASSPFIN